jgi:hypothetical protein
MDKLRKSGLALFLVVAISAIAQGQTQKRVSPDAYASVPAPIREELKKRGCELPETQNWDQTRLNIVQGQFSSNAQKDWVAICIAPDGTIRGLIFWANSAPCSSEITSGWPMKSRLPPGSAGSLYLLRADRQQILSYRKFFGDKSENPVVHDGVEVGGEEASMIYYYHKGKWLELMGND